MRDQPATGCKRVDPRDEPRVYPLSSPQLAAEIGAETGLVGLVFLSPPTTALKR